MNCMVGVKRQNIKMWISSFVLLFLFNGFLSAQNSYTIIGKSLIELRQEKIDKPIFSLSQSLAKPSLSIQKSPSIPFTKRNASLSYQAPKVYQYQDLAFFCRLEVKMDRASKMPVRFRLGSVDYVNRLEGKY